MHLKPGLLTITKTNMMSSLDNIYKKDGEGAILRVGEVVWQGEVVHSSPAFTNLPSTLSRIESFKTQPDDVLLLTYPKAGTHLMHEIVHILLSGKPESASQYKQDSMLEYQDLDALQKLPSPRVINTHMRLKYWQKSKLKQCKVVCCIRNPKSCAVSYYFHNRNLPYREYTGTFKGFLPLFIHGQENLYGSWFDFVQECWDEFHSKQNALFVCFEDIIKDPVTTIQSIAEFLGVQKDVSFYQQVAELVSFERMASGQGKSPEALKHHLFTKDGQNKLFRKGTVDDWKNYFTVAESEAFDKMFKEKMSKYQELQDKIQFE